MPSANKLHLEFDCKQKASSFVQVGGKNMCMACRTEVHDLTSKHPDEIIAMIKEHNGRLCGTVYNHQLEPQVSHQNSSRLKLAFAAMAALLTISTTKLTAQSKESVKIEQLDMKHDCLDGNIDCEDHQVNCDASHAKEEGEIEATAHHRRKYLFRIGSSRYYLSRRFPFIRKERRIMGSLFWL